MLFVGNGIQIYLARDPVDFRKSFQGLGLLVQDVLRLNPLSGHLFVFLNKRLDKIKVLYWDQNGFCLWQKRLEHGRFQRGLVQGSTGFLSLQEFQMLITGVDIGRLPRIPVHNVIGKRVG